ncbi:HAD family hydrolase [Asaia platycodi]|uniref:HAD family hydrolase n=1 Tax=Asaia platycodi TaxID=610243 RepID=UPI000471D8F5|nr:HAD family phosphatase [Asaia platycodi]
MTHALSPSGKLRLVIFDCDGVLIDSEGPSCRLVARVARDHGIALSDEESLERFAGKALAQVKRELEAETGRDLGADYVAVMQDKLVDLMRDEAVPIDGAAAMLEGVSALGLPFRVGSNSSWPEMEVKFDRVGFSPLFPRHRVHSARDMMRPKPDPYVFLHAAAEENSDPSCCVVVEDSDTGVQAAHDAGMACILLRAEGPPPANDWPGLRRIAHLNELVPVLADVLKEQAR